jgi:hypothetical protein
MEMENNESQVRAQPNPIHFIRKDIVAFFLKKKTQLYNPSSCHTIQ